MSFIKSKFSSFVLNSDLKYITKTFVNLTLFCKLKYSAKD